MGITRAAKRVVGPQGKRKLGPSPPILQIMILKLSPPRCVQMVIHIFTKAHILFCLPCSRYTLGFSPRLACVPPKLMGPGAPHLLTPLSVGLSIANIYTNPEI